MKARSIFSGSLLSIGLALVGPAFGQSSHDDHHPGGTNGEATRAKPETKSDGMMDMRSMRKRMMRRGMMGGQCSMMGMGDAEMHAAGRIAFIEAELAITDAQRATWNAYAGALKKHLESMKSMHSSMMARMTAKTPVEALSAHISAMEDRLTTLKKVKPMLEELYGILSEEQKKKADNIITGMGCMK